MTEPDREPLPPDEDDVHPPHPLRFTVVFSLDTTLDDREARVEDVFEHLGLRKRGLVDVLYTVKVPMSHLMTPPVAHLHRSWVDFGDELDPEGRYFFVLFSRRLFDLVKANTEGSDMTISLLQDGTNPELTRMVPLTIELHPPADMVDIFGRLFDQVQRQEERLQMLTSENARLRNRIGLITEYLASRDINAARTFGLLLQDA